MADLTKAFDFNLTTPIDYTNKDGMKTQGWVISVIAPSNKHLMWVSKLRQAVCKCIISQASSEKEKTLKNNEKSQEISDEEAAAGIMMQLSSSDDDIYPLFTALSEILTSGCGILDGNMPLTNSLYKEMSAEDTTNLLGAYLYNFFISSLMKKLKSA